MSYEGLKAGAYYDEVDGYSSYSGGQYSFTPSFTAGSIDNFETENNNTRSTADAVSLGSETKGRLSTSGDVDYYKFTTTGSGIVSISFDSPVISVYFNYFLLSLYDASGYLHSFKNVGKDPTVPYEVL